MANVRDIRVGMRVLHATPVFDTYWRFACERQRVFHARVRGEQPPWTSDPIVENHRFTNAYRASDRVSQYLIREVIGGAPDDINEIFFRVLLFKLFNKEETWQALSAAIGEISWASFRFERYAQILDRLMAGGQRLYSAAYIMPSPGYGDPRKHRNHLHLLQEMMTTHAPDRVADASSLEDVYHILLTYRSIGSFLAFQFAIDLNYSLLCNFSEMDFVVAGPGASDGLRKCFSNCEGLTDADLIRIVTERAQDELSRLDLKFENLWGRDLQLIDCQNLFCEVGKYARIAHPEYAGHSGRTKIKQKFRASERTLAPQRYPAKWGLRLPAKLVRAQAKTAQPALAIT